MGHVLTDWASRSIPLGIGVLASEVPEDRVVCLGMDEYLGMARFGRQ